MPIIMYNFVAMSVIKEIKSIDKLDLLAKKIVEGYLLGLHKSPFHGFSAEFREHRQFNVGDNIKNIDYKVYARTDKLFVKKYDEETNLKCQLVLDVSPSMYFPQNSDNTKLDFSVTAIASLMHLLKKQRDAYGLTVFADKIIQNIEPKLTEKNKQQIYTVLAKYLHTNTSFPTSNVLNCLDQLAYSLSNRSLIIVFTDMVDIASNEDFETKFNQVVQHLIFQKHDLILFIVHQKKTEIHFDYSNTPHEFVDMESGDKVKLIPTEIQLEYQKFIKERMDFLKKKCIQYAVDLVEVDTDGDYQSILSTFLRRRKKMKEYQDGIVKL